MDEKVFWEIIEKSRKGAKHDPDVQMTQLAKLLEPLTESEFIGFYNTFHRLYAESYNGTLWGAAYIIGGGCSDDGFDYFRAWLIAQGKDIFYKSLEDPDSLSKVIGEDDYAELEDILGLLHRTCEEKTGLEDYSERVEIHPYKPIPEEEFATWSDGDGDIDEEKAEKIYPKLFKKFW